MNITVIGTGAIGGWVAGRLALAGAWVNAVARGAALELLRSDGLLLTESGKTVQARPNAVGGPDGLGVQDLLIVAVKAPALRAAAEIAAPLIGPQTLIIPMLNGVPW